MVFPRQEIDMRAYAKFFERLFQQQGGFIEMEGVSRAYGEVDLILQQRTQLRGAAPQDRRDVIFLPSLGHVRMNLARVAVKELRRLAVRPARAEYPLERGNLPAVAAHDALHAHKILERGYIFAVRADQHPFR